MEATIHSSQFFKAYCNLGTCFRLKGNYHLALDSYLKAKIIKDDDAITSYNLANLYRIIGDEEKAIKLYEEVISLK
jgi:tetratricopeptide (TPR) repeat protein